MSMTHLSLGAAAALLMPTAALAQQVPPEIIHERTGVIEVTTSATIQYEPDRAYISFAVTTFAETAAGATEASAVKMTNMREALKRVDVGDDRVRTTSFRLDPHYPPDPETRRRQPQPDGYTAYNMLDVTVKDVEKVGRVIDAAIGAGADNVNNLRFGLEDMRSIHREALKKAFENAEEQASTLAQAAGKSLGTLVSVRTPPEARGGFQVQGEMAVMRAGTPIEPGTLSYSASVNVVFELR